ncbi:nucleotide sugar dehydrogenase [Roseospira visakhapatnamensis]|uniref:UDP-N-acetyl-D-galactosamine dehydrogenase n=1 Tax=Roseospira visakhapatnamensis TaxID=390880 RepID=A0A7W6W838_9PROT|nr:nucleotide sugar dehydrogenase [Roseospira visakhapatnamensis]MBB4264590.1 UDP-N-acetyl-D-galactosamine dehydrogenase [Roseospira visakhapatnamensis]
MADHARVLSVIGLGYVGLPVAVAFARCGFPVIAFDTKAERIAALKAGDDQTREVPADVLTAAPLHLTTRPEDLARADFHIVTVPTPINETKQPDLSPLVAASRTVGRILKTGDIVVYESTVFPGATETVCVPILEAESGLVLGDDFAVGYSPERINPGDRDHRFESLAKVVSASDPRSLDIIAHVYGRVIAAPIHRTVNIRTAEAAKVIENTQRDLNIALMNELAMIFDRLDIDTGDVLAAAGTKWNFLPFTPGLVGGHCIGVDPYYLTHRAEQVGYHPQVILAGRRINDGMGAFVARNTVKRLMRRNGGGPARVTVLGLTFKENVPDLRNTRVVDIVRELQSFGVLVQVHDPMADPAEVVAQFGVPLGDLETLAPADAVILAVPQRPYVEHGWPLILRCLAGHGGFVADVRACLDRAQCPPNVELWCL